MIVYNNDILVANTSDKEHLETLVNVFAKLQESGLKLKNNPNVPYADISGILGTLHIQGSIRPTRALSETPAPANVQLRSFLGLVNYYGKFLPQLASTLAPLYQLL